MCFVFRLLQKIYAVYAIMLFVLLMLPVFIWSVLVLPLGRIKAGNYIYRACMAWADVWFFLIGIYHKNVFVEKPHKNKAYIYVANHISYLDSALIPKTFRQPVRPLGKVEMSKIPVFGLIYKNVIVTVDRSNAANRTKSIQILKSVLRRGISVLVFPEGTFNTTHQPLKFFYDGAFRVAIETGTPVVPVLFLDAYRRMHYSSIFSLNPGKSQAIFLPEIPVEGLSIEDITLLKTQTFNIMESELVKRNAAWIGDCKN